MSDTRAVAARGVGDSLADHALALSALINILPDACLLVGANGFVHAANPASLKLLGTEEAQLRDTPVQELFDEVPPFDCVPRIDSVDNGNVERSATIRISEKSTVDVLVRQAPLPENLRGSLWFLRAKADLTRAERELQHKTEELEQASKDLEQFVFGASHDLKEPLRVINGHLDLLEMEAGDALNERARESMFYALDGVRRAQALINGLLTYSRTGFGDAVPEPVAAEKCLQEAMTNLALRIEETGAEVTFDPLPTVRANQNQLTMMFQNLLSNALKFVIERKPRIHIWCDEQDGESCFHVRDNGIGMEPQHIERIFRIFERLHRMDEFEGSGIGLALCKRIVEIHGGRIWVESKFGEGSTFSFTLGASAEPADAAESSPVEPASGAGAPDAAVEGRLNTLLVDDVPGIRQLVRIALERSGHFSVIGQAATGQEGIELARDLQPDAVLLDLSMPGMDGLEALPQILAVSPHSRVVIYSGFEDARLGKTAKSLGAAGYIEKGTEPDVLWRELLRLVSEPNGG